MSEETPRNDSFTLLKEMDQSTRQQLPDDDTTSSGMLTTLTATLDLSENTEATVAEKSMPTVEFVKGRKASSIVKNIPYTDAKIWKQCLDVYVPHSTNNAPVMFHIHGGGWSRGDRSTAFYGAPGLCDAYAGMGFVTVAMSYRLGKFPCFVEDVATAVAWSVKNLKSLSKELVNIDLSQIYISGHSAGGHIASLLLTDPSYLNSVGFDIKTVRGAIFVSGIYALKNPFSADFESWQNWAFQKVYINTAFVSHNANLDEASPAWRITQFLSDATADSLTKETQPKPKKACFFSCGSAPVAGPEKRVVASIPRPPIQGVPCLVLSAASDLGLDYDAKRFCAMLQELGTRAEHIVIRDTTHPSICFSEGTYPILAEKITSVLLKTQVQMSAAAAAA